MSVNQYVKQAAQQYRTAQVATADPARLVLMMYDGAIRFATRGVEAIEAGDVEAANAVIGRAQDIVSELMGALDLGAGEVAVNLQQMYDYIGRRLVDANIKKDVAPLSEAMELLHELRDTWQQIVEGEGGAVRGTSAG